MKGTVNSHAATVRGRVETVYYASPRFSAGRLCTHDGDSVSFAGALMVQEHDPVVLFGVWERHPKFGRQLKVSHFSFDQQMGPDGLAHYLANHPAIKGIGPVKARRIVETFGEDFDRVIDEEPGRVAQVAKLSSAAVDALREEWLRTRTLNAALTWLASFELTHHQVTTLIEKFGNAVVTVLKTDPYVLVREIPGFGFKRVDLVARKMGTPKEDPSRIRAGVTHCVAERLDQGDCWVDYEDLVELANELLAMDVLDSRERIEEALDTLIDEGALACPSIGGRFLVALPRIHEAECDLARVFTAQLRPSRRFATMADDAILRNYPDLNDAQRQALLAAARHNLVLVCGGAGSGKTHSIAAIDRLHREAGREVVLAAPTGKAAKRVEQVVGRPASTIHRLLGFNGTTFARDLEHPIDADVVIVDEVSMVDISLAWHLFRAIDWDRTSVVLVGDHNQLPPVGPGNLLRDLIERRPIPTVVLDQVVRQAGVLKESCIAVLEGQVRATAPEDAEGRPPWVAVNHLSDVLEAQRYVLKLFGSVLVERLRFDLLADVQLLTPTRKGPLGVDALNVELQRLVQKKLWGVSVAPPRPARRPEFLLHDRVIQTRNNYTLGVMNGAIGVVTAVGPKRSQLCVRFDDDEIVYEPGTGHAQDLALAYALTVHKCVHPDTIVETPRGLRPIRAIRRHGGVVATPEGPRPYGGFVENPDGDLLEVVTEDGYRLTVTPDHGIDVWTGGGFVRAEARDVMPGALLRLKLGVTCDPVEPAVLFDPPPPDTRARRYRYPRTVTADLAEFLGLMVADGTLFHAGFRLTTRHEDVRDRFASLCESIFGATPQRIALPNAYGAEVDSTEIVSWLRQIEGMEPRAKAVPECILRSPAALHVAFLRGLFENGTVNLRPDGMLDHIEWGTCFPSLEQFVRTMLLRLGIITGATPGRPGSVYLYGQNARRFHEQIGFVASAKQARASHAAGEETRYTIPLTKAEARSLRTAWVPTEVLTRSAAGNIQQRQAISRHAAEAALLRASRRRSGSSDSSTPEEALLRERLGFHYSAVREVRRLTGPSMCIDVPDGHRFLQNGFSAWNSQGSEFPCAVVVIHKAHTFMHHRNLFYTAVTRARKVAIVVGDSWGMKTCAAKEEVERRKTFLSVLDLATTTETQETPW